MRLINVLLILATFLFASDEVKINFKSLEIGEFVKMVSKITNKNILMTSKILGKVNFVSVRPVKKSQIMDLLISVLKNKGYTLVDSTRGFLQVVRSNDAPRESPPFKGDAKLNQVQTQIVYIRNLPASQMMVQIRFLLSKYGKVTISKDENCLIMTDYPRNLDVVNRLIKRLDSQKEMKISFYALKNSKVTSVLPKMRGIATSLYNQKIPNQKIDMFSDEGTNTLIMVSRKNIINRLLEYAKKLDKSDFISQRVLHIISLKNSDASVLVETLKSIVNNKPSRLTKAQKAIKRIKTDNTKPSFTADKETNKLIIYASKEEFKEIKTLIGALDVPRQQVYIEAKIVEISDDLSTKIGAKYGVLGGVANSSGLYSFSANLGAPAIPFSTDDFKLDIPSVSKALALGATISLLSSDGAADVISEPSLLCVNNMESSLYVGKTESIITQKSVDAATTDVTKNTYSREDIGLTLKVKPRISSDNKVLMDIKVTLEDILPGSTVGLPITTKRDVATTAIVKNGESIIIGGLIKDKINKTVSKVPLLGDIPILGRAFRYDEKENDKISLVVILTPYIINKSSDLASLREVLARLSKIEQNFIKKIKKHESR